MLTEERTAPTSLEEARSALADEWRAVDPRTPEDIAQFYTTSQRLGDDLVAWHATEERKSWTRMLVHVATVSEAKVVIDIGCGLGHDLYALKQAGIEECYGVEPNAKLQQGLPFLVRPHVSQVPIERADMLVCIDVLEHVPDPEAFLEQGVGRAKVGAIFFEATATHDRGTPLHLKENAGWQPGRWLEQHGWICVDHAGRVHVWRRDSEAGRQTSSLLLCSYKQDEYFAPAMALTNPSVGLGLWRFMAKRGDSDIGRSRAIIVTNWWRTTGDDTFLMIDHDIGFKPKDADRAVELCRNGYDIVCGAYPVHDGGHFACKTVPGTTAIQFGPGEPLIEIMYAATGFMAVHRRVIDKLITTMPLCHAAESWSYYPLFPQPVVEDAAAGGWARLSEDWGFSHIAREAGFKVWLDPQTILSHGSEIPVNVFNMGAVHDAVAKAG